MAILVLALGAFLSICGALFLYWGYPIIEVERGWASVIAGATALSGGIVTVALGLVLRTLIGLRATLREAVLAPPAAAAIAAPPTEEPPSLMTPELESGMLAAILASHEEASPKPTAVSRSETRPRIDDLLQQTQTTASDRDGSVSSEAEPDFAPPPEPSPEPPPKPRFKVNLKPLAPKTPPAPPPEPEPEAPAMDDWLDRAFSALDSETGAPREKAPVEPHPLPAEPAMAHAEERPGGDSLAAPRPAAPRHEPEPSHEHEPVYAPEPSREPEPVYAREPAYEPEAWRAAETRLHPEPPPPAAPVHELEPPPPEPEPSREELPPPRVKPTPAAAVIGRYEADGTSYVMYADGSIEAQSAAGVYRFASMAELKAYIENAG
jgi:hypothetical protein